MLTCPVCASDNVRRSRRKPVLEFLKRWRGLQRYRCRECTKVFHQPLGPGELAFRQEVEQRRRRRSSRRGGFLRRKTRQRLAEMVLFFSALVVFYIAFHYLDHVS